jgi:putative ABC transport system permease protein
LVLDVRYALRALRRTPAFTLIAAVTLAIGIGANTAIFSLVHAVLLRPLPFADPDRLVLVYERLGDGHASGTVSAHEFIAWRDRSRAFEQAALWGSRGFNLTGGGEAIAVSALSVSSTFFRVFGVEPLAGRTFAPGEDAGVHRVAVLSHRLWTRRFAADPGAVGRSIVLDDVRYDVVGVMPPGEDEFDPDLWVPLDLPFEAAKVGKHTFYVAARLRGGATLEHAQAELDAIARQLEREYPAYNNGHGARAVRVHDAIVGDVRRPVLILLGAVGFVLLIACANVAHLLLARAASRQKEIAVRAALGAGRGRLVAQLVTESLLLGVLGGVAGLLVAAWIVDLLPAIRAVQIPRLAEVRIDLRVLAVACGLSLVAGAVSGVVPAIRGSRPGLRQWLTEAGTGSARVSGRIEAALVVSEVALAIVLLAGAGLMIRSFVQLARVDPGFEASGVGAIELSLPPARYGEPHQQRAAFEQLLARLEGLEGVHSAATTTGLPLGPCCSHFPIAIEGRTAPPGGREPHAVFTSVSGAYFETMRIPLRRGRFFGPSDARVSMPVIRYFDEQPYPPRFGEAQASPVAIVNETMAERFWPGEDPVGRRFRILSSPWVTIVGVVGDVRQVALDLPLMPQMYLPMTQEPRGAMAVVMRTAGDPIDVAPAVREQIRALDPHLPPGELQRMVDVVGRTAGGRRFNAVLLGAFGALAFALSIVGLYGVISYGVAQRTHEIGIRTALGARPGDVLRLVLGRSIRLTALGIAVGVAGALAMTRLLSELLFEVSPTDPAAFAGAVLLLAAASIVATWLPARKALALDPLEALRVQ